MTQASSSSTSPLRMRALNDAVNQETPEKLDQVQLSPIGDNAPIDEQILMHLSSVDYEQSPLEIASFLNLNRGSVRSILSRMSGKGQIHRSRHGKYSLEPMHGVGLRLKPRVQNLVVVACGVVGVVSDVVVLESSLCRVTLTFGGKRGKVSYHVGVGLGLDAVGLDVVHGMVVRECEGRGYVIPASSWEVRNLEILTDYDGFRLEGLNVCTFSGVLGELEKYYNRPGVRREVRVSPRGVGLRDLRSLLDGGMDVAGVHRRLNLIEDEMRDVKDAVKGYNRVAHRLTQAILDKFTGVGDELHEEKQG